MTDELMDEVELVDTDDLVPYSNNPKEHPDEQIDKIAASIDDYGFVQPLVVRGGNKVVIGHGRLIAAQKLGLDQVPVIEADHLSEAEAKALRLADNRVSESPWDEEALGIEIDQLIHEEDAEGLELGFDQSEIDDLLSEGEDDDKVEGEVEFTEELREEHNYVVLYFEADVDWLQIKSILDLETVKALHSKDGYEAKGVGRVVDGAEAIQKIQDEARQ